MATERPGLFARLKKGLEEGIAYERGERSLRVTEVVVPDPPQLYTAEDVRRIRTRLSMSQAGFARLLQVSSKTVQSWEQGTRRPQQSSARLLQFIEHPDLLTTLAEEGRR
jgi:putative transcriptional regulator